MKKYLLILFSSFLMPILTNAQVIEWQNTIGGSSPDLLRSITQTADGGYILGGYSASDISGDKNENNNGLIDYWIVKIDSVGNIQWQNTIGGNGYDYLESIAQSADGGYILGGTSISTISGDKTENCMDEDYWIVKTDSLGIIQWQNTIGGNNQDELHSIAQTSDGGYILGGWSKSNISGDKTENSNGFADYWIVKTDSLGNIQWDNSIGGDAGDALTSIVQTADGGYILGGWSTSGISGDKTENGGGYTDYWIVKTDSLGIIQWQNTIGGSGDDELYSLSQTFDGGYILGGYSWSSISGDKTESSQGNDDYWIVKTDNLGIIQWQNTIGGNGFDDLNSIVQTSDGGYILGGFSISNTSGDKSENNNGDADYWIIKTDSIGDIQWQNTIGGNGSDYLYAITQTSSGEYILAGNSASNISDDKLENSNGGIDYWIVKITDKYNLITGKVFIDANSNGSQDVGELPVVNKKITESNTGRFGFSEQNGNYNVSVLNPGNYSVTPDLINYYNAIPASHAATFTSIQQTDSLNDFALQPAGVFNDLCVSITPLGPFRSGFNASYMVNFSNVGTTTLNPTVIFFPDNDVSFVSATPVASSVTLDSIVWNFGTLAPFQSGQILITVNVNTGVPIGTLINSGVRIEPLAGDANLLCNQSYWEVYTIGSYDPNDIVVDEDTLLSTQFPNPPFLEYLIRFQNTGNDTAFTVKILNLIDTNKLDLSTFEFVTSSQPVDLSWLPWERNMQFMFNNILLPDSATNEPQSHGFVRYRIQPKSNLIAGNTITNNAAIYFDFNDPILTNTATTHIVLPTSIKEIISSGNLHLYPNPTNSTLTIETRMLIASGGKLIVTDVAGRMLLTKSLNNNSTKHQIDISSFSSGIYFVQLDGGKVIERGRFVKE
ncbi:MAG: T9SS type A sorting domain-containing protein [Bacteroidetes bacterium]|nr:T9SS type A sorting domain-containing protein [Bacteroidota bacterium]MBK9423008.1 T9SS type A sorting domain-containing protein [Bacteroidota bacterium]